jgi:tetratricopeptide (TPR) repeat protein
VRKKRTDVLGATHADTLATLRILAAYLARNEQYDQAVEVRKALVEAHRQNGQIDQLAGALVSLSTVLVKAKQPDQAEPLLREAIAIYRKEGTSGPPGISRGDAQSSLCRILIDQQRYAEAETLLLAAAGGASSEDAFTSSRDSLRDTHEQLITLYEAWGKPDETTKWQKLLDEHSAAKRAPKEPTVTRP